MLNSRSEKNQNNQPQRLIYIVFSLLVLFSVIGLDFISWKKEKRSYFFSALSGEKKAAMSQEALEQAVLKSLTLNGISSESVQQFRDTQGALHLMVDLTAEVYGKLESLLESEFAKINAPVLGKEKQLGEEKDYYLWQVGEEKEKGLEAKEYLKERLSKGRIEIEIRPEWGQNGRGKYGRWLGIVYINEIDINAELIEKGHAEKYREE